MDNNELLMIVLKEQTIKQINNEINKDGNTSLCDFIDHMSYADGPIEICDGFKNTFYKFYNEDECKDEEKSNCIMKCNKLT